MDAAALPADRAINAYLWALRENADADRLEAITEALQPPLTLRRNGVPAWYGSDEDAWAEWDRQTSSPQQRRNG